MDKNTNKDIITISFLYKKFRIFTFHHQRKHITKFLMFNILYNMVCERQLNLNSSQNVCQNKQRNEYTLKSAKC